MHRYNKGKKPYDPQLGDRRRRHAEPGEHESEQASHLFRGAQEFQVGSSRQALNRRPHLPRRYQTFLSSASTESRDDQHTEHLSNEQTRQWQYDPNVRTAAQTIEQSAKNSSEQIQDDPIAVLEQARAIIMASDPGDPTRPPRSLREDKPTRDHGAGQQKQLPPSTPSSLRTRYGTDEGDPPIVHHSHSFDPGEEGSQPFKMQGHLSHVDNKDRPLTVRDMEHFTSAIQKTIRQMGSEFIGALTDMRRSEDMPEGWDDE